ncbi:hypothetical protein PL706_03205 [Bifidobacterium catenulatum]|uniref:hypothetical protein n=1 Tax=Bifidobacterium catenulatum TaxID=1686 RepID=UPI00232A9D3B|nr:hypothetical protein [Bifidobacterium catenulatum]MDB1145890.1 hypothetical protein [Bifidobacterium catenulatum]MDB1157906.1 hypothetical protein [Bifidobacterium catenulatum]
MAIFCGKRYFHVRYAELHGADFARNAKLGYLKMMIQGQQKELCTEMQSPLEVIALRRYARR